MNQHPTTPHRIGTENHELHDSIHQLQQQVKLLQRLLQPAAEGAPSPLGAMTAATPILLAIANPMAEEARHSRSLARALLLARVKAEPAIRLAVRWYLEAADDLARFEQLVRRLPREERQDPIARGRRQLHKCRQLLEDLVIEIREVRVGDPFDPQWHEPISHQPATDLQQADTVCRALTPAFAWRDEFGQAQLIPAKVIVLRHTPEDERG